MNVFLSLVSLLIPAAFVGLPAVDRGPARVSYRARLNRAVHSSAGRVTFRSLDLEARAALQARRVRCEVFEANSGIVGRAVF